jgi:LEA14-like dessication related protein
MDLDVIFKVANPNDIDLSLADVDYSLNLEGEQVASARPTAGLRLPGRSTVLLPFSTQIRFAQMFAVGRAFLKRGSAKFRAEGAVGIQTPVGILRLPFAKEGTVVMSR